MIFSDVAPSSQYGQFATIAASHNLKKWRESSVIFAFKIFESKKDLTCEKLNIPDFCGSKQNGLAQWSEQALEASHSDFNKLWEDFKVKSHNHPNFNHRILRAICTLNGRHLWCLIFQLWVFRFILFAIKLLQRFQLSKQFPWKINTRLNRLDFVLKIDMHFILKKLN